MEFAEFQAAAGPDGIFRGFDTDRELGGTPASSGAPPARQRQSHQAGADAGESSGPADRDQ